jgi:hypothetical protein
MFGNQVAILFDHIFQPAELAIFMGHTEVYFVPLLFKVDRVFARPKAFCSNFSIKNSPRLFKIFVLYSLFISSIL